VVHRIQTDHLHMRKICAKLVPENQTAKWGMSHEKFSLSEKARMRRSRVKTMIIVFFWQPWYCALRICTSRTDI
jgi:hypothetical protein